MREVSLYHLRGRPQAPLGSALGYATGVGAALPCFKGRLAEAACDATFRCRSIECSS
jgi:hypothetical protein